MYLCLYIAFSFLIFPYNIFSLMFFLIFNFTLHQHVVWVRQIMLACVRDAWRLPNLSKVALFYPCFDLMKILKVSLVFNHRGCEVLFY